MNKRKVTEKVTKLVQSSGPILLTEELLFQLQPGDEISAGYNEGWEGSDSAMDPFYFFDVERVREETDTEYDTRVKDIETRRIAMKKERYQQFLKLKGEFDN